MYSARYLMSSFSRKIDFTKFMDNEAFSSDAIKENEEKHKEKTDEDPGEYLNCDREEEEDYISKSRRI